MERYCQSCGMPLIEEKDFGTNRNQTKNQDYCCYCYQNGAFVQDCTMEEMVNFCLGLDEMKDRFPNRAEGEKQMMAWFSTLKRWKKSE